MVHALLERRTKPDTELLIGAFKGIHTDTVSLHLAYNAIVDPEHGNLGETVVERAGIHRFRQGKKHLCLLLSVEGTLKCYDTCWRTVLTLGDGIAGENHMWTLREKGRGSSGRSR